MMWGSAARLFAHNFDARLAAIVIWADQPYLGKITRDPKIDEIDETHVFQKSSRLLKVSSLVAIWPRFETMDNAIWNMLVGVEAITCMFRLKLWYQADHMDHGIILCFRWTNDFVGNTLPTRILRVDFTLFKLMYKWFVSLWLNHHCASFMEYFLVNSVLSLWLLLGCPWAPFGHPWIPLAILRHTQNSWKHTDDYRRKGCNSATKPMIKDGRGWNSMKLRMPLEGVKALKYTNY